MRTIAAALLTVAVTVTACSAEATPPAPPVTVTVAPPRQTTALDGNAYNACELLAKAVRIRTIPAHGEDEFTASISEFNAMTAGARTTVPGLRAIARTDTETGNFTTEQVEQLMREWCAKNWVPGS